jgi:hypothetical protein
MMTSDHDEIYKRGRAAIKRLTERTQNHVFTWWCDYGNAVLAVRNEAMRLAETNQPIGKAFNMHHADIMQREKLQAFDGKTRKDAVDMVENMTHPVDARRLKGIAAWRDGLNESERARLNHPTSIIRKWKAQTEPLQERQAAAITKDKPENIHLELVANAEGERDDARRLAEGMRELLGAIYKADLDGDFDLGEELRVRIREALK